MERLTKRIDIPKENRDVVVFTQGIFDDTIPIEMTSDDIRKVLRKLAEYEDLEEQGLLLRLPCKIGDTVYYIEDNKVSEFIVYSFDIRALQWFVCNYEGIRLNFKNFGKTIFLTQAEAEQKLKEMEGGNNEK